MKILKCNLKILCKMPGKLIWNLFNYLQMKRYCVNYDSSLIINGIAYISGNNIHIGKNVRINSGYKYNPIGGDSRTILRTSGGGTNTNRK